MQQKHSYMYKMYKKLQELLAEVRQDSIFL